MVRRSGLRCPRCGGQVFEASLFQLDGDRSCLQCGDVFYSTPPPTARPTREIGLVIRPLTKTEQEGSPCDAPGYENPRAARAKRRALEAHRLLAGGKSREEIVAVLGSTYRTIARYLADTREGGAT